MTIVLDYNKLPIIILYPTSCIKHILCKNVLLNRLRTDNEIPVSELRKKLGVTDFVSEIKQVED